MRSVAIQDNYRDKYVCVLGLGYVGLTLAAVMADAGFKVLGVEIRDDVLKKLRSGKAHFHEPGLDELIQRLVRKRSIKFVKHIPRGSRSSVYIITVGTPLNAAGHVRLDMVENVGREVASHLKAGDMVVLRSTVKIGTTRNTIFPILKKTGLLFDLAFCPERTLEGQALSELRQLPQIVGGATEHSGVRASQLFQFLTPTVVRVSDLETAETIKLIDNASRDVSFAYANEVAAICDKMGISASEVIRAGKLGYPRTNLPMPGLVGGPCLEKDPYILSEALEDAGYTPVITMSARRLNERQPRDVAAYLHSLTLKMKGFPRKPVISFLGIAFKGRPATDDLRGTMSKHVFVALKKFFPNAVFRGYDAVVAKAEIKKFGLAPCLRLDQAFQGANLVVITNNHPIFSSMPLERYAEKMMKPGLVYDFWNSFPVSSLHMPQGTGYLALGSHGKSVPSPLVKMAPKTLVTGGTGFIGAALVKKLIAAGHRVTVLDNNSRGANRRLADVQGKYAFIEADIRDPKAVSGAFKGMDMVIHLAFVNGTEFFYSKPELVLDVGVRGMLNVLDACREHSVPELILASSSEVYQSPPIVPTDETAPLSIPDVLNARYSYGGGKLISELMAINWGRTGFKRVVIFRPHNVYGADMGWEHVIPQFVMRAVELGQQHPTGKLPFKIQGDGQESRAFIHIDDFTDGLMCVVNKGAHLNIYHIGNPEERRIADVVKKVVATLGREADIIAGPGAPGGTKRRCPNIDKLKKLGFKPHISFDEGLPSVANWYKDNLHLKP